MAFDLPTQTGYDPDHPPAEYRAAIEKGERVLVGVNRVAETEPSPLQAQGAKAVETAEPVAEKQAVAALDQWRRARDGEAVRPALDKLWATGRRSENLAEATLACARAWRDHR